MENKEIWKSIQGYEGLYEVSNFGRVKSLTRMVTDKNGIEKPVSERIIRLLADKVTERHPRPHYHVELWKNNKRRVPSIHRLVAEAFIPNPQGKPAINHIDGNPANNHYTNLEWCTYSENNKHAYSSGLKKPSKTKPIIATNKITGEMIKFESVGEAARYFNVTDGAIRSPLKGYGRSKSCCGYTFEYQ